MGTVLVSEEQQIYAAFSAWLKSAEGKLCLPTPVGREVQRNRLHAAFVAGWKMNPRPQVREITNES